MVKKESQPNTTWRPSNLEPLYNVLPSDSPLRLGVPTLDRIVYAFSNTELKAFMFFYCLGLTPKSIHYIDEEVRTKLPSSWSQHPESYTVARLSRIFFCGPGFAEEPLKNHFATNLEGEGIAKDSAAFLLSKAVDLGTPYGPILRERREDPNQDPIRAYITRLAVLFILNEGKAVSRADIYKKVGCITHNSLSGALSILVQRGLISCDPSWRQDGYRVYERENLSAMPKNQPGTIQNIFRYYELNQQGTPLILSQITGKSVVRMEVLLNTLAEMGVVRAVNDAKITPLGLRFIREVIEPMLAAYSGDEQGLRLLRRARACLAEDPVLAMQALDQYKRKHLVTPEEDARNRILNIIRARGPLRRRDIIKEVGYLVPPRLRAMLEGKELERRKEGAAVYYCLPDSADCFPTTKIPPIDFRTPGNLVESGRRAPHQYRQDLDTVEFWTKLKEELLKLTPDQLTPHQFFMHYDPRKHGISKIGIYYNLMKALNKLGIKKPWEFLRRYNSEKASPDLKEAIFMAQAVLNKVMPLNPSPEYGKYGKDLCSAEFWVKLAVDVARVPAGTAVETFLRRFDPALAGNMGPWNHHGYYYNLRSACQRFSEGKPGNFLLSYRPPANASLDLLLAVRVAQKTIREHLKVEEVKPDDFSDIPMLIQIQKRKEQTQRILALKPLFKKYGQFDKTESEWLKTVTVEMVQAWLSNIRGHDVDDASYAAVGFRITKNQGVLAGMGFPAELRAAFLVYAFEQQRKGGSIPTLPKDDKGDYAFNNAEVKIVLQTLQFYLDHYQQGVRRKKPDAVLSVFDIISFLNKHIDTLEKYYEKYTDAKAPER